MKRVVKQYSGMVSYDRVDDTGVAEDDFEYNIGSDMVYMGKLMGGLEGKKVTVTIEVQDFDHECTTCGHQYYEEDALYCDECHTRMCPNCTEGSLCDCCKEEM